MLEASLTASSGKGDLPLPKARQHQSPCAAAAGTMGLWSTGCRRRAGKAAQHGWHREARKKSVIFITATSSALILEGEQLFSSSVPSQI